MLIQRTPIYPRVLGTGSALCIAYFLLALGLLHYLRPDYVPAKHMISDYAVGAFGWIMTSAFLALSISCLMLMLGLAAIGPQALPARIGVVLLGVASCGLVVTAIFPTDLPGSPETASGDIHNATFLLNVGSLLAATVLLTASFFRDLRWRSVRYIAILLAVLVVAAFVLQFVSLRPGAPYGLANRLFVVSLLSWLTFVSLRLRYWQVWSPGNSVPPPNNSLQPTSPSSLSSMCTAAELRRSASTNRLPESLFHD